MAAAAVNISSFALVLYLEKSRYGMNYTWTILGDIPDSGAAIYAPSVVQRIMQ